MRGNKRNRKSKNKIIVVLLIQFLSLLSSYAQNKINSLFFNLPLESSRDTIYESIKKYGFIEKYSNRTLTQNGRVIKKFSGYLDLKSSTNTSADSIKIQLSSGSSSIEKDIYYQNILIVWSYYHFKEARVAKEFYQSKKNEIERITAIKPYHFKNFEEGSKTGFSDKFYNSDSDKHISMELKKEGREYVVILEYQRNEGEKQLKNQFVKPKELVFRQIDSTNLFHADNVDQVPFTKKCLSENSVSIECFMNSIAREVSNNIDFDDFDLPTGTTRVWLNFIVDKNAGIINIKINHTNPKLCEEIMNSINNLKIMEPAVSKGIKVDFAVSTPLTITIQN